MVAIRIFIDRLERLLSKKHYVILTPVAARLLYLIESVSQCQIAGLTTVHQQGMCTSPGTEQFDIMNRESLICQVALQLSWWSVSLMYRCRVLTTAAHESYPMCLALCLMSSPLSLFPILANS